MRAALYLRVSTDDQTTENQRRDLEAAATRAGWSVAHVLADNGISGSKGRNHRPGFDQLHKLIVRREICGGKVAAEYGVGVSVVQRIRRAG